MEKIKQIINDTSDETKKFNGKEIQDGRLLAVLSYLSFFSILVYFASNNSFSKFHGKQGLNLFIISTIVTLITDILSLELIQGILGLIILVYSLMGMYYAGSGKAKVLPYMDKLSLIK